MSGRIRRRMNPPSARLAATSVVLAAGACSTGPGTADSVRADTGATATARCDARRGMVCLELVGSFHARANAFEASFYDHENAPGARPGLRGLLARYSAGRPGPGRYELGVYNPVCGAPRSYTTACVSRNGGPFYFTYHDGTIDNERPWLAETGRWFVSVDGELAVEESTADMIRGTFAFTGVEYAGSPSEPAVNGARVRVRGTFRLTTFGRFAMQCADRPFPAIVVEVRDSRGRPAAEGVTIVIQEGAFRDSVSPLPSERDAIEVWMRRPGRYQVRLHKPGYQSVVLEDVVVPSSGPPCNQAWGTAFRRVRLESGLPAPITR